jgi:hypothetical protein
MNERRQKREAEGDGIERNQEGAASGESGAGVDFKFFIDSTVDERKWLESYANKPVCGCKYLPSTCSRTRARQLTD